LVVDAGMVEEAVVLGRQEGMLHRIGNVGDRNRVALRFTVLRHQLAVPAEDAHRHLVAYVLQARNVGKLRLQIGVQSERRHGEEEDRE